MLTDFFQSEVGSLVYLTLLAAFANFGFGVWASLRDGTFELKSVAAFLRKDIVGRVTPIFGTLILGYAVGLTPNPPGLAAYAPAVFTLAGTGLAVVYIAEVFGRILEKLRPEKTPELTPEEKAAGVQVLSATRTPQD
jgi:hypothetical protein